MKIGIDVMGGDFAPDAVIEGAVDTLKYLSADDTLVLLGDESSILRKLDEMKTSALLFRIVPTKRLLRWAIILPKHFPRRGIQALL
jgi:glycerol-3-phosphate acyltransferase PlsX